MCGMIAVVMEGGGSCRSGRGGDVGCSWSDSDWRFLRDSEEFTACEGGNG